MRLPVRCSGLVLLFVWSTSAFSADTLTLDSTVTLEHSFSGNCGGTGRPFKLHVVAEVPLASSGSAGPGGDVELEGTGWLRLESLTTADEFTCSDAEDGPGTSCRLQEKTLFDGQLHVTATFANGGNAMRGLMLSPVSPTATLTWLCREPKTGRIEPLSMPGVPLWLAAFSNFRRGDLTPGFGTVGFNLGPLPKVVDPRGAVFKRRFQNRDDGFSEDTTIELVRASPVVSSARSAYAQYFLKGVSIGTPYEAEIDWKGSTANRKVVFKAGSLKHEDTSGGTTARTNFDVGNELPASGVVEVTAETGGVKSTALPVTNTVLPLPAWLKTRPFRQVTGLSAVPGIRYSADIEFPPNFDAKKFIESKVPLLSGHWGLISPKAEKAQARMISKLHFFADSDGRPTPGTLEGAYEFKFADKSLHFDYAGRHTAQLAATGVSLEGQLEIPLKTLEKDKNYSWIYVFPGVAAMCSAPMPLAMLTSIQEEVCEDLTFGASLHLHGAATFALVSDYAGTPRLPDLNFTRFGGRSDLDVRVSAEVGFPWIANASGRVGACGNLQLTALPSPGVKAWGGQLYATARAQLVGKEFGPWQTTYPFGPDSNCRVPFAQVFTNRDFWLASNNVTPWLLAAADGPVPEDSMPVFAASKTASLVEAHAATIAGQPRPASRIEVRTADGPGTSWGAPLTVSDEVHITEFPAVAWASDTQAVVVWAQSDRDLEHKGVAGFEIAWASVAGGRVVGSGVLTQDDQLDLRPQLCRLDEKRTLAVWQKTKGSTLIGKKADPLSWQFATWDGQKWSALEYVLTQGMQGVLDWTLACSGNGRAALAWTSDRDASYKTPKDRDIRAAVLEGGRWKELPPQPADGESDRGVRATYIKDQLALVWVRGDTLVGAGSPAERRVDILSFDVDGAPDLARGTIASLPSGKVLIGWPAGRGTAGVAGAWGGSFSQPQLVRTPENGTAELFGAVLRAGDALIYGSLVVNGEATLGELRVTPWAPVEGAP